MKIRSTKGFTLIELLIVVAIIGIIAAIAAPGLNRARMSGNEVSAIGSLRAINSAESAYASSCAQGNYAVTLAALGTPPAGSNQAFVSPDLASGAASPAVVVKSGYNVTVGAAGLAAVAGVTSCNGGLPVFPGYAADAFPQTTSSGTRSFASDNRGTIFQEANAGVALTHPLVASATVVPIQ